jgi:Fe(3+) dicitrate transport protein
MLNFVMKDGSDKPIEVNLEQSVGSFGLWNTFASVGGTVNKIKYYSYYQYRTGDGWRENSEFDAHLAFASIKYQPNERLRLGLEYSFLDYIAQQPGGLTDFDFRQNDISQAKRKRNWFNVSWNLLAGTLDYRFNDQTKMNVRAFGLNSGREALGNLAQIDRLDNPDENRTLIRDRFNNFGMEGRLLHHANLWGKKSAILIGGRYYDGLTERGQGNASASSKSDFNYLNPESLEDFEYDFPSINYALFAENILNINHKFSITPGIRYEWIRTDAAGYWKQTVRDFAGNIEAQNVFNEDNSVTRSFFLTGIGLSYYLKEDLNLYTNYSGNFRSVTFSDLRLNNPNFVLDSLITDERGYNMDLGLRGHLLDWMNVDLSFFFMRYNDRIGLILPAGSTLLLRTNVGDSRHFGLESFYEFDIYKMLGWELSDQRLSVFANLSLINATYIKSDDSSIEGKRVEYVPEAMLRTGVNYRWKEFKATYQYSYMGEQFSDGTNSVFNPSALTGKIPSYQVMDFSLEYKPGRYKLTAGVNNLTNEKYFTRRAEGYPGPGIIPATIRSFYLSLGVRL